MRVLPAGGRQLEGAFVLCRAVRTTEPLDVAGELMAGVVARALVSP